MKKIIVLLVLSIGFLSCNKEKSDGDPQTIAQTTTNLNPNMKPEVTWKFGVGLNLGKPRRNCFGLGVCYIKAIFVEIDWTEDAKWAEGSIGFNANDSTIAVKVTNHQNDLASLLGNDMYIHVESGDEGITVDSDVLSDFNISSLEFQQGDYPITIDSEGNYCFVVNVNYSN